MSKATVLRCDVGEEWDTDENPVRTVGVCGPKFDLCAQHRVAYLVNLGVPPMLAATYVEEFDKRQNIRGTTPTLKWAHELLTSQRNGDTPDPTDETVEQDPDAEVDRAEIAAGKPEDHDVPEPVAVPVPAAETAEEAPKRPRSRR